MAVQIQSRRSSTAHDRPFPIRLGAGELAVNNNNISPGLFFADNTASPSTGLIKSICPFILDLLHLIIHQLDLHHQAKEKLG